MPKTLKNYLHDSLRFHIIGKHSPVMMHSAAAYMSLTPEEVTVIGDTTYYCVF
jgi:ribonucleotide monophosphatase NagD (HAD superfamily)